MGLPVWRYQVGDIVCLEKRLMMPRGQNTVYVNYSILRGDGNCHASLFARRSISARTIRR